MSPALESFRAKLALERAKLLDAAAAFSPTAQLEPLPGGWSPRDLLAHVATSEALNVRFARLILSQEQPVQLEAVAADYPDYTGPFDLDRFNAYMTARHRKWTMEEVRRELDATRAATLAWLETLSAADLDRAGRHAVWGEQTVRTMLKILILHDKMHAADLRAGSAVAE